MGWKGEGWIYGGKGNERGEGRKISLIHKIIQETAQKRDQKN